MNESTEELASLYLLDQLDAADRAAFEARLLREPALAARVRELEAAFAAGIRSLPPQEPPAALLGRIEQEIDELESEGNLRDAQVGRSKSAPLREERRSWATLAQWGIAAVIAVSLSILAVQSLRRPAAPTIVVVGLDANRNTFAELPLRAGAQDADARFIQLASLAQDFWNKPGDLPLKPGVAPGDSRGYALLDLGSQQGFIAIEQLPAIAANQRYHLWVADASTGRVRDAGILPLAGINRGLYSFTTGPDAGAKSGPPHLFVTLEDAGEAVTSAPAQPHGKVVLGKGTF